MSDPNANRAGYKETKVGWIPVQWKALKISEVSSRVVVGIASAATHAYRSSGVRLFRNMNIKEGFIDDRYPLFLDEEYEKAHRRKRLRAGDVVTVRTGYPGLSAVVPPENEGAQVFTCLITSPKPEFVSGGFLCLYVNSPNGKKQINLAQAGGAQKNVNAGILSELFVPIPPLAEQEKIAVVLSTCDDAIEKTGDLIKAKQRQKKALMQQLLTGKKRLPGFKEQWTEVKIGDLFKEVSRPVKWDEEQLYKLISVRRRSGGLFFREALHGRDILTKVMNTTQTGDFLISKMQVVHGAMAMTPSEFDGGHVSGSYITLVARDGAPIHVPFFDYLSRTKWLYHLAFISSYGVVIEKMTFNLKDFLKKAIRIPPTVEEQECISQILRTCEDEELVLERKLNALKQQKKALMQKLLTGQVRVKL